VSTSQSIELVGEFFEVRAQVDCDLTTVSRVDRRLGLIKNLGRLKDAQLALISRYNNVTGQYTYIGGYQTCAVLISKNCAQLQVLRMKIPRKYLI
jgi:hypothetical protein